MFKKGEPHKLSKLYAENTLDKMAKYLFFLSEHAPKNHKDAVLDLWSIVSTASQRGCMPANTKANRLYFKDDLPDIREGLPYILSLFGVDKSEIVNVT